MATKERTDPIMTKGDPRIRHDADFLFEVDPKSSVFDAVRERVTEIFEREYGEMLSIADFRSSVRTNHIEITPTEWSIDATVYGETGTHELHVDLVVPQRGGGDAESLLIDYVESEVDERFGVDTERLRYKKIRLRSGGWFVDAVFVGE